MYRDRQRGGSVQVLLLFTGVRSFRQEAEGDLVPVDKLGMPAEKDPAAAIRPLQLLNLPGAGVKDHSQQLALFDPLARAAAAQQQAACCRGDTGQAVLT